MIETRVKTIDETSRVKKAADKAAYRNLGHAAASLRKTARSLIVRSDRPAQPGEPVHTRRGRIPNAILFYTEPTKQYAIIGPAASRAGPVAGAHEHGGEYRGGHFEPRPFMGPALEQTTERFARDWSASIGP